MEKNMNIHSPSQQVVAIPAFVVPITAAVVNGAATNIFGYTRAMAMFHSLPTGSGTTSDCKVQESADGSTGWVDVSGAAFVQVTTVAGETLQVADIDLNKRLQYLRLVQTGAGASAAGAASGEILLFNAESYPVTQPSAVAFAV
jgi:hypothetical protein